MAKSSSAPPQKTVKSLSFFVPSFEKLLPMIFGILIKFPFHWCIVCWGFFRSNISKNLPEGSKIGCFRPFFGGDISNTNKTKIYFRHKYIPGGQKTFSGFLRISQISNKSSCLVEMGSGYKIGDRYVTKSDLWHFHEIFPKNPFFEHRRPEYISRVTEKCLKCWVTVPDWDSMS